MKVQQKIILMLLFSIFSFKAIATNYYTASPTATIAGNSGAVNVNWTTNSDGLTGLTTVAIATGDNLIVLNGGVVTITATTAMSIAALTINQGATAIHNNNATGANFDINGLLTWNGTIKTLQAASGANYFNANGDIVGTTATLDINSNRGIYLAGTAGKTINLSMAAPSSPFVYGQYNGLQIAKDRVLAGNCKLYCPINYNQNSTLDLASYSLQVPSIQGGVATTRVIKGTSAAKLTLSGAGNSVIFLDPTLTTLNTLNIDDAFNPGTTSTITINGNLTVSTLNFGTPASTNTRSIQLNGNFTLPSSGMMHVQTKGTIASTQYSQLKVNGNMTIGSSTTLQIDLINSYSPSNGPLFNFAQLTSGTITGSFGTTQYPTNFTGTVKYPSANTVQCQLFVQPQFQLDWTEDFTGNQLSSTEWFHRLQGVWRDGYNDPTATSVANGNLIIQPYTDVVNGVTTHHSDEIASKRQFLYGRIEAKIAMTNQPASWSAFWLQSNTNGNPIGNPQQAGMEMDIVESLPNDGKVHTNLHWDGYGAAHKTTGIITGDVGANSGNYHIYAMDWTPDYYKFYVDGNLTWTYTANISRVQEFIIFSTEIQNNSWAGSIPAGGYGAQGQGGTKMQVDYVKYYSIPNNPPTVAITSPANNTNFNANSNITFTVNAADPDGNEVTKVEYFRDAIKLGETSTAPFSFTWANAIGGNHSVTAKVTDSRGASTTSTPIVVNVGGTSITSPANNSSFNTPTTITITAGVVNATGTSKVEFFQGTTKLGEDFTAPYSFNWSNMPIGNYALTVKSTDNNLVVTTSDTVYIVVNRGITSWTTSRTDATISGTTAANWDDGTGNQTSFNVNPGDSFTVLSGGIANINTAATTIGGALTINLGGIVNTNMATTINGALKVTGVLNNYAATTANGLITIDPTGTINHIATTACNFNGNGDLVWNGTIKAMKPTTGSSYFNLSGNISGTSAYLDVANNSGIYLTGPLKTINLTMSAPASPFNYGQYNGLQIAGNKVLSGNSKIYCPINYNANCTLDLASYSLQVQSIQGGSSTKLIKANNGSLTISGGGNATIFLDPSSTTLNALNVDDAFMPNTTASTTITGDLTLNTLNFGNAISTNTRSVTVNGNFTLANNGTIHLQTKGTTAGTQYNQLKVQSGTSLTPATGPGNFSLGTNTTLQVDAIDSYDPANGDAYNFIPYAGTFGANNFATIINPSGHNGSVTYANPITYTVINITPTVSITSPVNNASFVAPASVTINADASDANGTIAKVEFFQGTTKLGEDLTAPYSFSWNNVPVGSYSITAVATDNDGASTTSGAVNIFVNAVVLAVADAFVRDGGSASANYGSSGLLTLKKDGIGYNREVYLKFDLSGVNSFDNATLRLNISTAGTNVAATTWQVHVVPTDSWSETGINWNNKPASSTLLGTIQGKSSGWAEWNITSQALSELSGDKTISLRIVSTVINATADVSFRSKEDNTDPTLRPQLVLTSNPSTISNISSTNKLDRKMVQPQGLEEAKVNNIIVRAYPNPVKDVLHIKFDRQMDATKVQIFNVYGSMLLNQRLTNSDNDLNVSNLTTGLYLVKVFADNKTVATIKIIKVD